MLTEVVKIASTRIPNQTGTAPPLREEINCPPIMTFTVDHPIQAATLKIAIIMLPTQTKEKREIVIWRKPNFGPSVEKKATGKVPRILKITIIAKLSQKPRPKSVCAKVPNETVEMTR